jgi:hypothetical protein
MIMRYFYTKYGNVIDENNQVVPMIEGDPEYEQYLLFLQADGTIEQSDVELDQELEELRRSIVPQIASKMRFFLALYNIGITRTMVYDVINQIQDADLKEIILIKFDLSQEFDRNDEHLNLLAGQFNISQQQLDDLFIESNT